MTLPSGITVRWMPVPAGAVRRDVAWALLRTLIRDPDATITNACPRCGGPHGPVRIHGVGVRASVTYAGGFAIVCVADDSSVAAVGIDAEATADPRRDAADLRGIVQGGRPSTLREWTRIEAVLKADGRGLRVDPAAVSVTSAGGQWNAGVHGSTRRFTGWDVPGPPRIVVSVAIEPVSDPEAPAAGAGRATS